MSLRTIRSVYVLSWLWMKFIVSTAPCVSSSCAPLPPRRVMIYSCVKVTPNQPVRERERLFRQLNSFHVCCNVETISAFSSLSRTQLSFNPWNTREDLTHWTPSRLLLTSLRSQHYSWSYLYCNTNIFSFFLPFMEIIFKYSKNIRTSRLWIITSYTLSS